MNALIPAPLVGEVIPPEATVRAVGKTHPLNGGRIECFVRAGLSITEILMEALADRPGLVLRRDFIVHIDGHVIAEENWSKVRVKAGATLTFTLRPQNANVLRTVLSLVVVVAAFALAGPGGSFLAGTALGSAVGLSASVAGALVSAGIVLAGTMALNALFPVSAASQADNVNSTTLNSISGAQNQANPFGSVPVVLGVHRQSPYLAAKWYTQLVGEDQYLCGLLCWGYGQLIIEDIKIGDTPLSSFTSYDIEHRTGTIYDAPITLYPGQVDEVALQFQLSQGSTPATAESGWVGQVTSADADAASVDITAPEGVFKLNEETGNLDPYFVYADVRYRLVGTWDWFTLHVVMAFFRTSGAQRRGHQFGFPARGQYEVQVRKNTPDANNDKIKDKLVWTALRSIKYAAPISFPKPLALTAIRIKATDQLSGVISNLSGKTSSCVLAFNGTNWIGGVVSSRPPDLFRWVLQGPANARPVPDSQIDLPSLEAWWFYCVSKGFAFNQVINAAGSLYDKLTDIAAAGRAVPTFIDGKWGVIWDRPDASIVQHFTPRNSWGFQGQRTYAQQPHGWRVSFINEKNGYTQDERIVYDDGYDATNATLFEGIQFPGVTDPDLIWKHGRFHIAQSRLRPEKISLNVGWEHLVCTRGDRVLVTHDVVLIGLASGRVKSVAGQVVTFDEIVTVETGKSYGFQFRVPEDVRSILRLVNSEVEAGEFNSLVVDGDLSLVKAGTLFGFGEAGQESATYRVQGISHQKDLIATLTLVDDAPEIAQADTGVIPDYNPHVSLPVDPFTLPPRGLIYLEVIDGVGASVRALVRLSWQVPRFGKIASFEVQQQDNDGGGPWTTVASVPAPQTTVDIPVIAAGSWSYRVRCIFADGTVSDWASLTGLSLQGLTFAPGDITNLHQHSVDGQTVLDWDTVTDPRTAYYEVRKGTSWDTGLLVGDVVTQPPWPTTGDGTYHVRAYVLSPFNARIYSAAITSITIAGAIISRNIVESRDEQATGWPGGIFGGVRDGDFIRTDLAEVITEPVALGVIEDLSLSGLHIAVYISPTTIDIGRAAECRFWTEYEASGVLQGDDFLSQPDVLGSGDILGTSPTRFIEAFPIWRFSTEGETDIFAPSDVFGPTDIFTGDITWQDWVGIASGTRVSRFFQPGFILITNDATTDATGTKFRWFVDVPDRNDDYTGLTVPDTGLNVTFYTGGYSVTPPGGAPPTPFNGGPNGSSVPHVQRAQVNSTNGDEVKITNLSLSGCTVHVVNGGANVTRSGVNLLVRGY